MFDDSSAGRGRLDEKRFVDNLTDYDEENGSPAQAVEYTYDDLGRVLSIIDDRGTTSYTYNNDGLTTKIDSPDGIVRYQYEPLTNRLTRTFTTDGSGEVVGVPSAVMAINGNPADALTSVARAFAAAHESPPGAYVVHPLCTRSFSKQRNKKAKPFFQNDLAQAD